MHKGRFAVPPMWPIPPCHDLSTPEVRFVSMPRDAVTLRGDYDEHVASLFPTSIMASIDSASSVAIPVNPRQLPHVLSRFPNAKLLPERLRAKRNHPYAPPRLLR